MDDAEDAADTDFAALGAAVDAIAFRSDWLWTIGQEAARDWTDGRAMTADEAALVRGLQMAEDRRPNSTYPFHTWWLNAEVGHDDYHPEWPPVWAATLEHVTHPVVAAHLADLAWVSRHGDKPHLYARRAIGSYLAPWPDGWQHHDRDRALMRAFDLAHGLNDAALSQRTEERLLDEAADALDQNDKDASEDWDESPSLREAVHFLEHSATRKLADPADKRLDELVRRAWLATHDPDTLERLSKVALPRAADEAEREAIVTGVIQAFRTCVPEDEPFRRLMFLREALRVAEERGHPSYASILHEIETLDMEDAYEVVRHETVFSRSLVSDFCVKVVGTDGIEAALTRFAYQLTITPENLASTRATTEIGIEHLITSHQIGEANSVVTSSETSAHDLEDAVERDVHQQMGRKARRNSYAFLVPALHQLLEAYSPWDLADLRALLGQNAADDTVADALARGLEHFHNRLYDDAAHIALPRVERLIRQIARACGVATTKRPTKKVGGIRGLGEILVELRGDGSRPPVLPEPLLTSAELTLVDADSLNLRNDIAHGIKGIVDAADAALILQLGISLSLTVGLRENTPEADPERVEDAPQCDEKQP